MRKQNPPQAYLENAEYLERYLRLPVILPVYAIAGLLCIGIVTLTFTLLIHNGILSSTPPVISAFVTLLCLPVVVAVAFCFLRPRDPMSAWLMSGVRTWRQPLELHREDYTLKELLGNGEGLSVKLAVYSPARNQTKDLKERLYLYMQAALARDCSMRIAAPDKGQIDAAIEPALEIVASESGVPVLYSEVLEVEMIQADFNFQQGDLESAEYWRTGT
ncbi:MAG: hypothetical protein WBD10_03670 [Acidobacteriaceae bacterium]